MSLNQHRWPLVAGIAVALVVLLFFYMRPAAAVKRQAERMVTALTLAPNRPPASVALAVDRMRGLLDADVRIEVDSDHGSHTAADRAEAMELFKYYAASVKEADWQAEFGRVEMIGPAAATLPLRLTYTAKGGPLGGENGNGRFQGRFDFVFRESRWQLVGANFDQE